MKLESVGTPGLWAGFIGLVLVLLALDLLLFHRKAHEVKFKEALITTAVWVSLAMGFAVFVYRWFGTVHALEFLTGYVIEEALSVDNLFVFLVIFRYFSVPKEYQQRVLLWGILGAIVLRIVFIVAGTALIQKFHWVMYIFGAFLFFTGLKLLRGGDEEVHPEQNPVLKLFRRMFPVVSDYRGAAFFVVEQGKRFATPLLMVLVLIEATDVVFAVDSIPAVFAVTTDPFIVFTSNIFAVLGLRALYFALSGMMAKFHYLKVGLGLVLSFVGVKMLVVDWYKVPIGASLGVIALLLAASVIASLVWPEKEGEEHPMVTGPDAPKGTMPGNRGEEAKHLT